VRSRTTPRKGWKACYHCPRRRQLHRPGQRLFAGNVTVIDRYRRSRVDSGGASDRRALALPGLAGVVPRRLFFRVAGVSYALHVFINPEGTELFQTVGEYRLLREEQKERHRRYREITKGE